jgi:hypothetical protein
MEEIASWPDELNSPGHEAERGRCHVTSTDRRQGHYDTTWNNYARRRARPNNITMMEYVVMP